MLWSSEEPDYGGTGTAEFETPKGWHLPANTALVLGGTPRAPTEARTA